MTLKDMIDQISSRLSPQHFSTNPSDLMAVSRDESSLEGQLPAILTYPTSTEDISFLMNLANHYRVQVTARGAGSSLEGNSIPEPGGMVIDLSHMNRVISIRENDLQVTVEPGVIYKTLNESLKSYGLFFPPSPGGSSDIATIGGMVSTNASGIYSVKYGATRDYILKLKMVAASGDIYEFGSHSVKSSSGYNLVGLICGSEGTLGIISEITLKLSGLPESNKKLTYQFTSERDAVLAIADMMKYALNVAALEFLDSNCITALNLLNSYGLNEKPTIFIELQGTESGIEETESYISSICDDFGGQLTLLADGQNPWAIRHHTTTAIKLRKKDHRIIRNDIAFPISKLPDVVEYCYDRANKEKLLIHTFGHVGLGILHVLILADPSSEREWSKAQSLNSSIINYAIDRGGTTSGEHGIGLSLRPHMEKEHGTALQLMRGIKKLFDPNNILNPSKIFPSTNP